MSYIATKKELDKELSGFIKDDNLLKNCKKRSILMISLYSLFTFSTIALSVFVYLYNTNLIIISILLLLISQRHLQTHVHDSAHLFISGNRKLNDLISNFLYAGFIGMTIENYRLIHQKHHKFNGSEDDPEYFSYEDVKKYGGYLGLFLSYAIGIEAIKLVKKYYFNKDKDQYNKKNKSYVHIILCQFTILLFFINFNVYFFYFIWLYLALTVTPLLSRLRFLVEHPGKNNTTRTTTSVFIEKIFFAPHNFNYHYEHHMFPMAPPYHLDKIYKHLKKNNFYDNNPQNFNTYFLGALIDKSD